MPTTRAVQIECLLTPIYDYRDNSLAVGYTVTFYAAGTSTLKNVWTEKEKNNPYTTRDLGSDGTVQVYGQGVYKITIEDDDETVIYEWDNVKVEFPNFSVVTKTSTYTATPDDDVILVDTDGGNVTINLQALANFSHPLTIKNVGTNSVIIDGKGAETIDGSTTVTFTAANYAATLYPGPSEWKLGQVANKVVDADGDTYWDAEESADEDILRAYIGGTEQLTIQDGKIEPTTDNDIDLGASGKEFKDAYIDGIAYIDQANIDLALITSYRITGAYNASMPTNGVGANAKFMMGLNTTIIWMYLNVAPPGWKVTANGADMVCGISGGAQAFNANGGTDAGTWTVAGLTKNAHTHAGASHNHQIQNYIGTDTRIVFDGVGGYDAQYYDAGGNAVATPTSGDFTFDLYTSNNGSSGAQSSAGISSNATWRPAAALGKLMQLDTS